MRWISGFLVATLVLVLPSILLADYVEVRRNAYIYADPDRTSPQLDHIDVNDEPDIILTVTQDNLENGYYEIRLRNGAGTGWIYKSLVRKFAGDPPGLADYQIIPIGSLPVSENSMVAHFIDVGQGDATLLEFACGVVLIDTGGENTAKVDGTDNLNIYLDAFFDRRTDLGRTLDLVVLTHPHLDHTRSVPTLLNNYTIRSVLDNGMHQGSGGSQQVKLQRFAKRTATVSYQAIEKTDIVLADGLTNNVIDPVACGGTDPEIRVLWGSLDEDPGWADGAFRNPNNHSVVVRVDFGESSFLFTGDLQEAAINDLVFAYNGADTLDVDVYQVGHHGSHNGTTEDLMRVMTPEIAIISMGDSKLSQERFSAYSFAHPRDKAVQHLSDPQYGVSAFRAQVATVPVGEKGACNTCQPKRPPAFEDWKIAHAIYGTGWEGTVSLSANNLGEFRIAMGP